VPPHEQHEQKAARALQNIKPRRPTAFARFSFHSGCGDEVTVLLTFSFSWRKTFPRAILLIEA
jgi:hypothetical protein